MYHHKSKSKLSKITKKSESKLNTHQIMVEELFLLAIMISFVITHSQATNPLEDRQPRALSVESHQSPMR